MATSKSSAARGMLLTIHHVGNGLLTYNSVVNPNKEISAPQSACSGGNGRNHRLSDKVAAQHLFFWFYDSNSFTQNLLTVEAQNEAKKLKAKNAECRAHHKKMVQQKLNQQAGLSSGSEDEFQSCKSPTVCCFTI